MLLLPNTSLCLGRATILSPRKGLPLAMFEKGLSSVTPHYVQPVPLQLKGPLGASSTSNREEEEKKNTQTTFAFDLIILHGEYMAPRASVWGPFGEAMSLTTSAPTLINGTIVNSINKDKRTAFTCLCHSLRVPSHVVHWCQACSPKRCSNTCVLQVLRRKKKKILSVFAFCDFIMTPDFVQSGN